MLRDSISCSVLNAKIPQLKILYFIEPLNYLKMHALFLHIFIETFFNNQNQKTFNAVDDFKRFSNSNTFKV